MLHHWSGIIKMDRHADLARTEVHQNVNSFQTEIIIIPTISHTVIIEVVT